MRILFISKKCKYCILIFGVFSILLTTTILATNSINTSISLQQKIDYIMKSDEKFAYLTFDDGPTTRETEKILDILKREDVKATFFVVGKHVKELPQIVKREYEEGHYIANHGYSHNNRILYNDFRNEIINTEIEIRKAIGVENYCSYIFRFPNGYKSKMYINEKKKAVKILEELNYAYIDWNCLNKDSENKITEYQLLKNIEITSKDKNSLVILMHDTGDVNYSSKVLSQTIQYLRNKGYTFKNMYDLLEKNKS